MLQQVAIISNPEGGSESNFQSATLHYLKCPVFNKKLQDMQITIKNYTNSGLSCQYTVSLRKLVLDKLDKDLISYAENVQGIWISCLKK